MRWLVLVALAACSFDWGSIQMQDDLDDAGLDAVIDAASPDSAVCPTSYTEVLGSSNTRYRIIIAGGAFNTHHATCNADAPGRTHLVSLETAAEATQLQELLAATMPAASSNQYYVGAVQRPNQTTTTAGWSVFSGAALPDGLWGPNQPTDDGNPENNQENLVAINALDLLHDVTGDVSYGAVCECDGQPVDPTVASYLP